jgi:hypothetical protein
MQVLHTVILVVWTIYAKDTFSPLINKYHDDP